MQRLDSKKIDGLLKQIENVGKGAIRQLNDMTDGTYKDSDLEKDPLKYIGVITQILQQAQGIVAANARFNGMSEEQIATAQAAEAEAEKAGLQKLVQERLAGYQPKEEEPTAEGTNEPEEPGKREKEEVHQE